MHCPPPCSNNALYSYASGVYSPVVTTDAYEDHAVTLVGYTDMWINSTTSLPVWIIKNRHACWSWSGGRGLDGGLGVQCLSLSAPEAQVLQVQ